VASSITGSIAAATAPAGSQKAENRPNPDANGDGLIGMFVHGFVSRFRAFNGPVANAARDIPGAFQRGGETFAGFADFFPGYVSRGSHQRARVFGERSHVITGCVCMFIHGFQVFCLFVFIISKLSIQAA
jgi:hypothetical protein